MSVLKITRTDGKVFEFEFNSYGRGQWAINLVSVDGEIRNESGDPDYATEREARKAARETAEKYTYFPGLGWAVQ